MAFPFKHGENSGRDFMNVRGLVVSLYMLGGFSPVALAQAVIEGRVDLPKTKSAPVMAKRYEIVEVKYI